MGLQGLLVDETLQVTGLTKLCLTRFPSSGSRRGCYMGSTRFGGLGFRGLRGQGFGA